jgi:hypothetical protein
MILRAAILCAVLAAPALAQSPLIPGDVVSEIEMIPSRTVRFAPEDGGLRIITVVDGERFAPVLRAPGEVGMALTFAQEIGTVLEFNSGLDWTFAYDVHFIAPDGSKVAPEYPVCPVGSQRVGGEQWPQPYPRVVISNVRKADAAGC